MNSHNAIKVGINGFGRMGFCALRKCIERSIHVRAINAFRTPAEIAYLLRYDSVHGKYEGTIDYNESSIIVGGQQINLYSQRDLFKIPWKELDVDYVIECTGKFLKTEELTGHIKGGAKKVILSAPAKDNFIPTFVFGVNEEKYSKKMNIVSNASCTTNCLAPLAKVLHENFGIASGIMTTVHAMTGKQNTVDGYNAKDLRVARAAHNIIPSSTGAAKAVGRVLPELCGKLTGMSLRVPIEDGSIVDLTVNLEKSTSYDEICQTIAFASQNEMVGVMAYTNEPIVSSDIIHNPHACIFDEKAGIMLNPNFVKVCAWYDNEWGYMSQLISLLIHMHKVDNK